MAKLSDILSLEDYQDLDNLVRSGKIKPEWVRDVFIPRLVEDLNNIAYWEDRYDAIERGETRTGFLPMSPETLAEKRRELQWRRDNLYQRALVSDYTTKLERELSSLQRGLLSGAHRLPEYLKEAGPVGVAKDVGTSLVESIPRGVAATGQTFTEGLGERPLQRIGEMTGAVPIVGGGAGLAARLAGRSALKAAGKSVIRSAGVEALKDAPAEAIKEALESGVGGTRASLAKTLSKVAEGTRYPGYAGEGADIAGAGEDVYVEGFLEILGEGAVEGGRFAGRRAVEQLKPGETDAEAEVDPIQQKQQQRAADNDAAAAQTAQRARGTQAQAALDALALQLVDITHKVATGKDNPSVDDIYRITPEAFVNAFENHIYPGFVQVIAELEEMGVYDAENVIRANILDLHKKIQAELNQQLDQTGKGETPEQAAAADMAGQPEAQTDETPTTDADLQPETETTPQEDDAAAQADEVDTSTEITDPDDADTTGAETTQTGSDQGPEAVDWGGLDADVGNDVLETLSQDPDADMEAVVDSTIAALVDNQTLSPEDGQALKTTVVEQITPAVEELKQKQAAERQRAEVPEEHIGPERVGFWSDEDPEKPIHVRLVVRELEELIPSHDEEGNPREDYPEGLQPRQQRSGPVAVQKNREDASRFNPESAVRFSTDFARGPILTSKKEPGVIIAGTGRRSILKIVHDNHPEKWEALQQRNRQELEDADMDPSILDDMTAPVVTYELVSDLDEVELAKDTNRDSLLGHSDVEDASFDASLLEGDILFLWDDTHGETDFAKALESPENQNFRNQIISKIPKRMQPQFLTSDNKNLSDTGKRRLQNAMIRYVFDGELGKMFGKQLIDSGAGGNITLNEVILNSMPTFAKMKANGIDIGEHLTRAINRYVDFDNAAEAEASSEDNKRRETGPLTKEELLWRNLETSFATLSFVPEPLIENQLLYLLYAKKKGNAYKPAIITFREVGEAAIELKRREPDADAIKNTENIINGAIVRYLTSEAYARQAEKQSLEVLIDRMPPEVRAIRMAYEAATGAEAKKAAAEAQIMEILKLMNQGQQAEVDPNETETETTTPDGQGVDGTGPRTPQGTESDVGEGGPDRGDTGTSATPESEGGVAPAQQAGTDSDEPTGAEGDTESVPTDDRGSDLSIEEALDIASVGTVSIDAWNAGDTEGKRSFLQKQEQSIPVHLQTGAITEEEAARKREAIELLRRNLETTNETTTTTEAADTDTTTADLQTADSTASEESAATDEADEVDTSTEITDPDDPDTTGTETTQTGSDQRHEAIDTNQVVGVSRRQTQTQSTVSPLIQQALDTLGITVDEWEAAKAAGEAESLLNTQPQETDAQLDAVMELAGDIAGEMAYDDMVDDLDLDDDEDFFSDVEDGILRDITDQQRSDFETVRRKLFLARTIQRLEAKGLNRTPIETAYLRALTAPQRTDAQQKIYEELLTNFINERVARLQSKPQRTSNDNRILEALTAVQAEGLPEEASEMSLYADLDTPDQAHSSPLAETRTLAGVQAPETAETELNLPESVTADTTKLSPAQQSSVKAIVSAFLRKIHTDTDTTVQGGFLLADKPGVGKTRQALATIWHYIRSGVNRHFVLAPNQQLLDNYSKDMQAMGGPANDISNYDSGNQKVSTPIGTATYSMLIRTPNLRELSSRQVGQDERIGTTGFQNAIADIVEHLTGARPTFAQTHPGTHPGAYQAQREAFDRIFSVTPTDVSTVEKAIAELRKQAGSVNVKNRQHVEQFRARLTPRIADALLAERTQAQGQLFGSGSELYQRVWELMNFGETVLNAQPDPDFQAKARAFDGVIVLDEMHKATGTDSQTGQMIATLHRLLPNAKFLYMSATPFKEIDNFWVAERLGLWGANQPFPNFDRFRSAFSTAARAVKEVIPLHLKQIGRYLSRALSSKETRYTPTEIPLTDTEKQQYDTAVQLVQGIHQRLQGAIDAALRSTWGIQIEGSGVSHLYRAKYMRMYYNTMQKFFLALLDAMKAQGLTENIREKLQNGDKVIVQLENTWEKVITEAKERGKTGTIGPFDLLIDFVENEKMFPVHEHTIEIRTRRDGSQYEVVVPRMEYNAEGEQVRAVDPNLKRLQTQLIESLRQEMQKSVFTVSGLPFAADIIHSIAAEAGATSGEISGRSEIYVDRNAQRMPQDPDARIERTTAFSETTDLNLIVLGPAGLTGINLPISEKIKDKVGALYHYLVQSSWNVNTFEQGLGRGKRANSAIDPHYIIAHQDLPGADRVLGATLAKFAEMGALAGQADNALMQNIDKVEGETSLDDDPEADVDTDVFDEEQTGERGHVFGLHGQEALTQLWYDIYHSGDAAAYEIVDRLGLTRPEEAGGTGIVDPATVPTVQQFFSRLLHQSTADQQRFYQQFEERLKRILTYKKELGQLDVGASNLNSKDGQITDRLTIYTDPDTGQTAEVVRLNVKRQLPRRSWDFLQKVVRGEPGYEHHGGNNFEGIYKDADGHVWAVFEHPFRENGEVVYNRWGPRGTPVAGIHEGENRITAEELANDFERITTIDDDPQARISDLGEAQQLWEAEDTSADTDVDSEMFMATGLILPKWRDFSTPQYRGPAVMGIIPMIDGSHLHGRVIPSNVLSEVLTQIGGVDPNYFDSDRTAATPDDTDGSPNGDASPDIDIPAIVRDIIGQQTDTQIAARLNGIVEHIHKKLPLRLRGHLVRSAAEAALLGQLIRDPQVEHTWIAYKKNDRIVKIEPMSLNRKGETKAGDFEHIKREAGRLQADAIMRIHNHPSGVAKWSDTDKKAAMEWHTELGTLMAEDIIVDSGTYAYRTFENGEYTWHQGIALDPQVVEWATGDAAVPDPTGELRPDDPLYQNPLIRGAREAAAYMLGIKHRTSKVAELIFVDSKTGKITDAWTDSTLRGGGTDPVQYLKDAFKVRQGQQVHIALWGDDAAVSLAQALQEVDGVDSVWVNSQRITGMEHVGQQGDTDNRTQEQRETDAILNRTLERLSGKEQPGTKRKGQDKLESPKPHRTIPRKIVIEANKLEASQQKELQGKLKQFVKDTIVEITDKWDKNRGNQRLRKKLLTIIDRIHPYRIYQAYQAYQAAGRGAYQQPKTDDWRRPLEHAIRLTKVKDAFYEIEDIALREILSAFRQASDPLSFFQGKVREMDRMVGEKFEGLNLARDATGKPMTQVIDGQTFYLTPLDTGTPYSELTPEEQAATQEWLKDTAPRVFLEMGLEYQITDTLFAYLRYVPPTGTRTPIEASHFEYVQKSRKTAAEHRIRYRRAEGGTREKIYNSNKLLASRHIATTTKSNWDAITDNADFVFLAPADKHYGAPEGFGFDSEYLIREKGAVIGTKDSIQFYDQLVERIVYQELGRSVAGGDIDKLAEAANTGAETFPGAQRILQRIKNEMGDAAKGYRVGGEEAIKLLREGKVAEILVPGELSLDDLLYIVVGGKRYGLVEATDADATADVTTDSDNVLRDYQPTAETPNINRAARAMPTKDQLTLQGKGRTRKWISPQSKLFEKLRLWTPKLREHKRIIANAIRSGYGLLEELKAPFDSATPGPGDIIEDMLDQRMHLSQTWTGRTRSILTPVLKKLTEQVKRAGGADAKALRAAVDHDIINFIEHNTPLRSAHRAYETVATEIKEAWRKVNQSYLEAMIGLIRDISHREEITKVGSQGRVKWAPEPIAAGDDTMKWDWSRAGGDGRFVGKGGKEYTIAEAFARADKLYYPHQYDRSRLRHYNRKMEDLVKALNELSAKGHAASGDALATAGVEKVTGGYLHRRLKITFPDLDAVIKYYTDIRDRTATLLKMYDDGTIGMYPHLERVRETQDRLYRRDTSLLMSTSALLWDRFAEIATFGQIDDLGNLPPRLVTMLQTVELYNANDREAALMAVIDGLQATKESRIEAGDDDQGWGMHESIPAFEGGEAAALRIMQQWEDYYIDDDGNKVKTGKWKGIDINALNLDGKTIETLQQIGFIQSDGRGGWQVHGKTDAAQQTTIARFFVELMQTKANRKKRIQALVQSLGHWQQSDPLTEEGGELWRRLNTLVSIGALGWKQALQNLTEIPVVAMMAGMKSTAGMVKEMRDPDFRAAAQELVEGTKQGVEFLADDNLQETYLNSAWSMFGYTERTSRMLGVGVGLTHARNLSQELLASQEGSKERGRIEREMRRMRMNPEAVLQVPKGELDAIYKEIIQRIKDREIALAGVELPSATPPTNPLTDRIGEEFVRSAMYLSDAVFKPYDARTLPDAFNSKDPRFRVFLKFKGWMFQQNRFIVDQYKRAYREARQHRNFRPLGNMLASTLMLTGTVAATQAVFAMLQGRDNDDELLRAFLHTQTLGLGSVLWEIAMYSEGSPWRLEKSLEGLIVGPVWGTFADILSPTATGDLDRTFQEILQRTPGARELLHLGVDRWWEDE